MGFLFVYVVIVVLMCFLAIDMRTHGMLLGIRAWSLGVSGPSAPSNRQCAANELPDDVARVAPRLVDRLVVVEGFPKGSRSV